MRWLERADGQFKVRWVIHAGIVRAGPPPCNVVYIHYNNADQHIVRPRGVWWVTVGREGNSGCAFDMGEGGGGLCGKAGSGAVGPAGSSGERRACSARGLGLGAEQSGCIGAGPNSLSEVAIAEQAGARTVGCLWRPRIFRVLARYIGVC